MTFQLVAEIDDPELLAKSIHEFGTIFYQEDNQGTIMKVAYFSGTRVIEYNGKVDETLAKRIRAEGYAVDSIEINSLKSSVRITQKHNPEQAGPGQG